MSEKVDQMNADLQALVSGTINNVELDMVKVLNTEDPTPIENTLLTSTKTIDELNQKETLNNVFTIGNKDQPVQPVSGKEKSPQEVAKKQEEEAKKQEDRKQFKDNQSKQNDINKKLSSDFNNVNKQKININSSTDSLADISNQIKTNQKEFSLQSIKSTNQLKSLNKSNIFNKDKYISTSLKDNSIDSVKLLSNKLTNDLNKNSFKYYSVKSGFKEGNILDKININEMLNKEEITLEDQIKKSIKNKTLNKLTRFIPSNIVSFDFNNGSFGMNLLNNRFNKNFKGNINSFQDIVKLGIKWLAQKVGREIECLLNLLKGGNLYDTQAGMSILSKLQDIKIFCDNHIAKKLGISDDIDKLLSSAQDLEIILTASREIGDTLPDDVKKSILDKFNTVKVLQQLDLLDKLVRFTAGHNDPSIMDDILNNNDLMKEMFDNINALNREHVMDLVTDKGNYHSTRSLIEQWGKHKVRNYKTRLIKSHNNTFQFNDTQFNTDVTDFNLEPDKYFSPDYESEPVIALNDKSGNGFQDTTLFSLNKVKEIGTLGNEQIIPDTIKDITKMLNKIPIV